MMRNTDIKPNTVQRNLAKLPIALAPLIERPQWAVWRWTQKPDGNWQKPPFMATEPSRHASTNDPATWADYPTALAAVQAGDADGISYILTKDDPFGAIDLDHCRDKLCSIDVWAQNYMQCAVNAYQEVTPSGEGIRIWGYADGDILNRKFTLKDNDKDIAAELFRHTNKALTITGYRLNRVEQLTNIDHVFTWAITWGERRKAAQLKPAASVNGNGFDSTGCKYTIDDIERLVCGEIQPANRSDAFHAVIGHYTGCGWQPDRILEHLAQYPDGIGSRYLREDRLQQEIDRSAGKFAQSELPLSGSSTGWTGRAPEPESPAQEKEPPPVDDDLDDELLDDEPETQPDDEQEDDGDDLDGEIPEQDPNLPRLYAYGQPEAQPYGAWLIKDLIPEIGKGLLAGQWGTGKTVSFIDCATSLMTGQPWLDYTVKRQCAVLLIAGEGQTFLRRRIDAAVLEKCGSSPMPLYWYKQCPPLLDPKGNGTKTLIAMARQAQAAAKDEFGLPLGLIGIDTIASCAGFRRTGDEQDNAVGQAIMNSLDTVAQELGCFVFGIDHFGKNIDAGVRGGSAKEAASDVVLACLGNRQPNGTVTETKLAVRKCRDGEQGREYPYRLRTVDLGVDEDGKPIRTVVMDWIRGTTAETPPPQDDPWLKGCRQDEQRAKMSRFKQVLHAALAEHGTERPIPTVIVRKLDETGRRNSPPYIGPEFRPGVSSGSIVRMVEHDLVRDAFFQCTPNDPRQTQLSRFNSARDRAEYLGLVGIGNIDGATYLWLTRPEPEERDAGNA